MKDQFYVTEERLHIATVNLLRNLCAPGVIWWHTPNGMWQKSYRQQQKFKAMGLRAGVPDLVFVKPPDAKLYALELKSARGSLTPAQKRFRDELIASGGIFGQANSIDDACSFLLDYGILVDDKIMIANFKSALRVFSLPSAKVA